MFWAILGLAAALRFFMLGVKPPHFDEGINGWFVDQMVKNGFYRYDPTNYHGPLHFYVLFLFQSVFGRNVWALRVPAVLASIGSVWVALNYDRIFGRGVARIAALAMAVSPGFVFYGRYSIHEVWLVLFSMMFVLGLLGLWRSGTADYLWYTGIGIAGMILTKETYIIHLGCALIAIPFVWICGKIPRPSINKEPKEILTQGSARTLMTLVAAGCLLLAFFLPWAHQDGIRFAGFGLGKLGLFGSLAWGIPLLSVVTIVLCLLKRDSRILSVLTSIFSIFIIGYFVSRTGDRAAAEAGRGVLPQAIGTIMVGGYLTLVASVVLLLGPSIPETMRIFWKRPLAVTESEPAEQTWTWVDLAMVCGVAVGALIFFYSGTFLNWGGVKGLYQTFDAWFKTGHNGNGHEKPFYYWLMLIGRYEWPVTIGLLLCGCCQLFRTVALRYLAISAVGIFLAYSIVNYKTPWCIISIVWPLLFIFAAFVLLVPKKTLALPMAAAGVLLTGSFAHTIVLNYFRCSTDTQPYVYVQTYNDIYKLTTPVLDLARSDPKYYHLTGHIIRPSPYPLPWILDDFPRVGYYEHENLPPAVDADFLLVEQEKIGEVETGLHDTYYTMPLTIRPYQDTSKLYLRAAVFKHLFGGRPPDFVGTAP
jgi:hypothetical protein